MLLPETAKEQNYHQLRYTERTCLMRKMMAQVLSIEFKILVEILNYISQRNN